MGYIHDSGMVLFADRAKNQGGTWTHQGDDEFSYFQRTAGAGANRLYIPIQFPHQNTNTTRGSRLITIDVFYKIEIAALTTLTAFINLITLPTTATGVFTTCEHLAFTYDNDHDNNGERVAVNSHTMTLTLTTPQWVPNTKMVQVLLSLDCTATAVFSYWATRVNYTFRI